MFLLFLVLISFGLHTYHVTTAISCAEGIDDLIQLTPEECDPTGRPGPDIYLRSHTAGNNGPHYVIGHPDAAENMRDRKLRNLKENDDNLLIFLHGTDTTPSNYSCLLKSLGSVGPTIGLTYGFLGGTSGGGDTYRNQVCGSHNNTATTVQCLKHQHIDAIYGGRYGININGWGAVDNRDSISGRLGLLLKKLDDEYPSKGWDEYYISALGSYPEFLPTPRWNKIVLSGHSQGAGHAAYLAHSELLAGATLFSGPQDECVNCLNDTTFWIDEEFRTKKITAFAHGDAREDAEPTIPIIKANWKRMTVSGGVNWSRNPFDVIDFVSSDGNYDVCKNPIVSTLAASSTSKCDRKGHCSTAADESTPYVNTTYGESVPIYSLGIWNALGKAGQC